MNLTSAQKTTLQNYLTANNRKAYFVAYNPNTVTGTNPETAAIAAGYTQYLRQATANLVEVIYTANFKTFSMTISERETDTIALTKTP